MRLFKSMYDKDFYNDVINNQTLSKAIWYWIGISQFVLIACLVYFGLFVKNELPVLIDESIPEFTIQEGILEIEKPIYLGIDPPTDDIADFKLDY